MRPAISISSSLGVEVHQSLEEVEAHAAHAGFMQPLQFGVRDVSRLTVATPRALPAAAVRSASDHRAVVVTVTGGLHDDIACEAEMIAKREELLLRGIAGRVFAPFGIGKSGRRPEDVTMRIDRAFRKA